MKGQTFARLACGVLERNVDLRAAAERNPASLVHALLECARLGHEPGTDDFYLVPLGGSVEGWEGYQGKVKRMYNGGAVKSVIAEVVYENDTYDYQRGVDLFPRHTRVKFGKSRGVMVGAYAYAVLINGSPSRVVEMDEDEIMEHKAASKTGHRSDSFWVKWPRSAWLKTVCHELEKWVPTSAERLNVPANVTATVAAPERLAINAPAAAILARATPATEQPAAPPAPVIERAVLPASGALLEVVKGLFEQHGIAGRSKRDTTARLAVFSRVLGREITTPPALTEDEAKAVRDHLIGGPGKRLVADVLGLPDPTAQTADPAQPSEDDAPADEVDPTTEPGWGSDAQTEAGWARNEAGAE